MELAEATHLGRYNGKRAAFVTANMKNARNISEVRDDIWRVLDEFERGLPESMTLARGFDQSRNVDARLRAPDRLRHCHPSGPGHAAPARAERSAVVMVSIPLRSRSASRAARLGLHASISSRSLDS